MAQPMPESVKWTEVHAVVPEASEKQGHPFTMKMSRDEVMILLGLSFWWTGTPNAGDNALNVALWRKTDSNPPGSIYREGDSPDMIWSLEQKAVFVTESLNAGGSRDITFPWPIVLIRPPRAIINVTVLGDVVFSMRLYYLLREIKDVDLAKLMVKDHA